MTAAPKLTHIPDLLEHHYEELQFLWAQREHALRSPRYTMREFSALERRIEAHVQGILVAGDRAIPLLEEGLTSDDSAAIFASAYGLLRLENETATLAVIQAFTGAHGPQQHGLRQALVHARPEQILPTLPFLFFSSTTAQVASAADVLAHLGALPPPGDTIEQLLQDADAGVRETAWRVVANAGLPVDPKLYAAAQRDEEVAVRRAGLLAAAWNAVPGALLMARKLAESPSPDALYALELLAIVGGQDDLQRIGSLAKNSELGPARFRLAGSYGHPGLIDLLLNELANSDPEIAAAAGAAFTKITGQDIDSSDRTSAPPKNGEQPDEFEVEFLEEITLPDPAKARTQWEKMRPRFARATRVCRGLDLSRGAPPGATTTLDMESRWELYVRSKFTGAWSGTPAVLERFPQQ